MSTILGIWAHPDDEVFVSGGLMADAVRRGERVVCVHMTRGEAGLSHREPCAPEVLGSIREQELRASLAHLGVEEPRFFGYPDGHLSRVPRKEAIARILDTLHQVEPDVILTFGTDGFTGHPDHQSLSSWVTAALDLWDNPGARLLHSAVSRLWKEAFVSPLNEFDFFWPGYPIARADTDLVVNLDEALLDTKVRALQAHASQMKALFDAYGEGFMRSVAATEHFAWVDGTGREETIDCKDKDARITP